MRGIRLQRVFITIQFKRVIFFMMFFLITIIVLSVFLVGFGAKKGTEGSSTGIKEYKGNNGDIVFNNSKETPNVRLYLSAEDKIIDINLEEYVRGVVCAEMPAEFGIDALKAQAVAARTYALAHMESFGGTKCKYAKGADLCDTINSQVYMSKEKRMSEWKKSSAEEYWSKITQAVNETSAQILTYDGKLVMDPFYFAVSSGKTENAAEVFSVDRPYLKSVVSQGEESSPKFKSSKSFTYSELANKINSKYNKAGLSASKLKSQIKIIDKTSAGSVMHIKVGNLTITGDDFRGVLGLDSSNFSITYNSKNIVINSIGYGHGVGMSQWGAGAMAKSGSNYAQILTHYYQGVKIEKIEVLK